jgi:hypothetical protein
VFKSVLGEGLCRGRELRIYFLSVGDKQGR